MEDQKDKNSQDSASSGGFAGEEKTGTGSGASAAQMKREFTAPDDSGSLESQTASSNKQELTGDAEKSLINQAKETAAHAYDMAAEKAATKLDEQKTTLSDGLATVANSVRKVGENLHDTDAENGIPKFAAQYTATAAKKIEQAAQYFETKDIKDMYHDVETFARKNPAIFVGGAFVLGILAARFIKSSSPKYLTKAEGATFGSERSHDEGFNSGETRSSAGALH